MCFSLSDLFHLDLEGNQVHPCCCKWQDFILFYSQVVWQPTPVLLPGEFNGLRSLVGYSPWGHKELDTTERLHFQ